MAVARDFWDLSCFSVFLFDLKVPRRERLVLRLLFWIVIWIRCVRGWETELGGGCCERALEVELQVVRPGSLAQLSLLEENKGQSWGFVRYLWTDGT